MRLEKMLDHELANKKQYLLVDHCENGDCFIVGEFGKKDLISKILSEFSDYLGNEIPNFHFSYSTEYAEEEEVEGEGKTFVVAVELLRPSKFGGSTWSYRWCIYE